MTNVIKAIAGGAGMPWQKGSANLTNWSQLTTNVLASGMQEWQVRVDAATNYYARSGDGVYSWTSNNFTGLANRITATASNLYGTAIYVAGCPKVAGGPVAYELSGTITNAKNGINWIGAGNPLTVWRNKAGYTNFAFLQFGTEATDVGGISAVRRIRFDGTTAGTNAVAIHDVKSVELCIEDCEISWFGLAGVRISTTNGLNAMYVRDSWFGGTINTNSIGILIDGYIAGPTVTQPSMFWIVGNLFTMQGGRAVVVSNWVQNVVLQGNYIRPENGQWGYRPAFEILDGRAIAIKDNYFDWWFGATNPIAFAARGSSTNIASVVSGNTLYERFGTNTLVYQGANITGLLVAYNSTNGVSDTTGGAGEVSLAQLQNATNVAVMGLNGVIVSGREDPWSFSGAATGATFAATSLITGSSTWANTGMTNAGNAQIKGSMFQVDDNGVHAQVGLYLNGSGAGNLFYSNALTARVHMATNAMYATNLVGATGDAVMEWGTAGGLNTFTSYGSNATTTVSNLIVSADATVSNVFTLSKGLRIDGPSNQPFVVTNTSANLQIKGEAEEPLLTIQWGTAEGIIFGTGVTFDSTVVGNLGGGTNLNATQLKTGTVAPARMATNAAQADYVLTGTSASTAAWKAAAASQSYAVERFLTVSNDGAAYVAIYTNSHAITGETNALTLETWVTASGPTNKYYFKHFDAVYAYPSTILSNSITVFSNANSAVDTFWGTNIAAEPVLFFKSATNESMNVIARATENWQTNGVPLTAFVFSANSNYFGLLSTNVDFVKTVAVTNTGDRAFPSMTASTDSPFSIISNSTFSLAVGAWTNIGVQYHSDTVQSNYVVMSVTGLGITHLAELVAQTTNGASGGNGLAGNLVAVWEMEAAGDADQTDATAGNHTLTAVPTTTQSATHKEGTYSSGGGGYYSSASTDFRVTTSFSLASWVNPNGQSLGITQIGDRSNVAEVWQCGFNNALYARFAVWNSDGTEFAVTNNTQNFDNYDWHLVVAVWDSTASTGGISVDGSTITNVTLTGSMRVNTSSLWIGGGPYIQDETAFWTKALTQDQINTLYNSGTGFFYSGSGWAE